MAGIDNTLDSISMYYGIYIHVAHWPSIYLIEGGLGGRMVGDKVSSKSFGKVGHTSARNALSHKCCNQEQPAVLWCHERMCNHVDRSIIHGNKLKATGYQTETDVHSIISLYQINVGMLVIITAGLRNRWLNCSGRFYSLLISKILQ